MLKEASLEKPPVKVNKAGVSSVSPEDVLRSRAGQAEIQKTIRSNIYSRNLAGSATGRATAGARAKR
jgi:hypothetical protein